MKNLLSIIVFNMFTQLSQAALPNFSLEEAIAKKMVNAEFRYASGPQHKSIATQIYNLTARSFILEIPPGTLLESEISSYQNHLITKHDTFTIRPNQSRKVLLTGMCCESYDICPAESSRFYVRSNPRPEMVKLCLFADSLHLNGHETQTAIWALANRSNPNNVYGYDSTSVMQLRNFVEAYLKLPVENYKVSFYVKHVRPSANVPFNYDNTIFVDSLTMKDKISMELYSDDDNFISAIPHEQQFIYMNTLNLFLSCIRLSNLASNTNYIIRLKKNNVVYREWLYKVA